MLNDPYWCLLPKIGAGIITTPPEALTQTYIDPYVYFGRVDQAATLHFQTQVYVPGNCGNVTVELRRRRYNASTVTWGPPQTISTQSPALTVDGSWLSGTATFDFSFTYLDNGRNDFELVLSADCPGVLHNANGDVFAVWSRYDGARNHIYTARHPAATTWDATVRIDSDTGSAGASQIAVNANGDAFAVWYQFDGTRYNIWSNRRLAA
ncbi:MAG: hypothetical protein HY202_02385, partial [Nitrospirae bacterium]|nr:hypothetical protein [Nitrospirota bacterium]